MSGIKVCRQLRVHANPVPILMLTAMGAVQDRVTGLRWGADDYLTKPFSFDELLARIESLMRRPTEMKKQSESSRDLKVGDLVFDRDKMQVTSLGFGIQNSGNFLTIAWIHLRLQAA